ncbi:Tyrosine recombinase xerD [Stenotrophomonas maltophilia RA8]|uniref:tyrosine-type recombinase/integrase n=1 Tax=Stenotrophomonas maltophilia TaxID=40324 RepID=UPI0002C537FD|nr:tyrosine-type recombinase/integrase [Stenotrophomonas maltophilia]CCP18084.1 Tyrosine recombinase xerD [Stenotrophomonas maltophilia RA8]
MPERAREGLQHAADRRRRRPTALRYRFDKARETAGIAKGEFQFRDLRAKAGTDKADSAKDIREAQAQLGHSSVTTTEIYVRKKRESKATPTR